MRSEKESFSKLETEMTVTLESRCTEFAKAMGEDSYVAMDELLLDGMSLETLGNMSFLKKCKNLHVLSMNSMGIKKLETFPEDLLIESLELADNKLSEGLEALSNLKALVDLHLNGNEFASVKDLSSLVALPNLKQLEISGCPLTKNENYRSEIFALLPSLEIIDMHDKDGNEVSASEQEDEFDSEDDEDDDSEEDSDDVSEDDDSEDEEDDDEEGAEEEEEEGLPSKKTRTA